MLARTKHFQMLPRDNTKYDALYVQMVRVMVRKEVGHGFKMTFSYTTSQREALCDLIDRLKLDAANRTEESEMDVVAAYHRFCWLLVHAPEKQSQRKWGNPIERFLWLKALRADGSFLPAKDVTPILAQLKYFCRLVTLYQGLSDHDAVDVQEDPLK